LKINCLLTLLDIFRFVLDEIYLFDITFSCDAFVDIDLLTSSFPRSIGVTVHFPLGELNTQSDSFNFFSGVLWILSLSATVNKVTHNKFDNLYVSTTAKCINKKMFKY